MTGRHFVLLVVTLCMVGYEVWCAPTMVETCNLNTTSAALMEFGKVLGDTVSKNFSTFMIDNIEINIPGVVPSTLTSTIFKYNFTKNYVPRLDPEPTYCYLDEDEDKLTCQYRIPEVIVKLEGNGNGEYLYNYPHESYLTAMLKNMAIQVDIRMDKKKYDLENLIIALPTEIEAYHPSGVHLNGYYFAIFKEIIQTKIINLLKTCKLRDEVQYLFKAALRCGKVQLKKNKTKNSLSRA